MRWSFARSRFSGKSVWDIYGWANPRPSSRAAKRSGSSSRRNFSASSMATRFTCSTNPPRAFIPTMCRNCSASFSASSTRQHRHRGRARSERDPLQRLDHRRGPRGRRRRRTHHRDRHPGARCEGSAQPDRPFPEARKLRPVPCVVYAEAENARLLRGGFMSALVAALTKITLPRTTSVPLSSAKDLPPIECS